MHGIGPVYQRKFLDTNMCASETGDPHSGGMHESTTLLQGSTQPHQLEAQNYQWYGVGEVVLDRRHRKLYSQIPDTGMLMERGFGVKIEVMGGVIGQKKGGVPRKTNKTVK